MKRKNPRNQRCGPIIPREGQEGTEHVGSFDELLKLDPKKVKSIRVKEPKRLKLALPKLAALPKAPPKYVS